MNGNKMAPEIAGHTFEIVGDEDGLIVRCGTQEVDCLPVGIYEETAAVCPVCGKRLVLHVGRSWIQELQHGER